MTTKLFLTNGGDIWFILFKLFFFASYVTKILESIYYSIKNMQDCKNS